MTDQELLKKADDLSKAVEVLLKGLATDGTAIEGFVKCYEAQFEYTKAVFEREIERLTPPLDLNLIDKRGQEFKRLFCQDPIEER